MPCSTIVEMITDGPPAELRLSDKDDADDFGERAGEEALSWFTPFPPVAESAMRPERRANCCFTDRTVGSRLFAKTIKTFATSIISDSGHWMRNGATSTVGPAWFFRTSKVFCALCDEVIVACSAAVIVDPHKIFADL